MPLTKLLSDLHFWVHSYLFWYILAIEIGTTWKMRIDPETPHFCSKAEIVSQFLLRCFDRLYSVFFKWAKSRFEVPPWCWDSPAHSPRVTLGSAAPGRLVWEQPGSVTCLIHSPSASHNNKNSKSASSSHPPATNQHQGGLVSRTSNASGRTQGSQKALRGSGNSFLHFTKNASLWIDKIKKDGKQPGNNNALSSLSQNEIPLPKTCSEQAKQNLQKHPKRSSTARWEQPLNNAFVLSLCNLWGGKALIEGFQIVSHGLPRAFKNEGRRKPNKSPVKRQRHTCAQKPVTCSSTPDSSAHHQSRGSKWTGRELFLYFL